MNIREFLETYEKEMHIPAGHTYPEGSDYGFYRGEEGGEVYWIYHDTGAENEHVLVDYSDPVLNEEI